VHIGFRAILLSVTFLAYILTPISIIFPCSLIYYEIFTAYVPIISLRHSLVSDIYMAVLNMTRALEVPRVAAG
jgi:hypothetical protein